MDDRYAPHRRRTLALLRDVASSLVPADAEETAGELDSARQLALSIPESIRALGEPLAPFFEACGGPKELSVAVGIDEDESPATTYVFNQPFVLIGRCPASDLCLNDPAVGFRAAYLQLLGGRWLFVNLSRQARTDSAAADGLVGWFDARSLLRVGPYTIRRIEARPEPSSGATQLVAGSAGGPHALQLELLNGPQENTRPITKGVTLLGSSRRCDVRLRDDSVSKIHASLVRTPHGLWVVDLLGRHGIQVDGQTVYWKRLHDGNELRVGRFQFRVNLGSDTPHGVLTLPRAVSRDSLSLPPAPSAAAGAVSNETVLLLLRQMSQMQAQFLDHSQFQMQMMQQMLSEFQESRQAAVRQDMARIDEIGRELKELQAKVDRPDEAGPPPLPPAPAAREPAAAEDIGRDSPEARLPPVAEPTGETHSQSRLTRRMAELAEERNSRWRRVLQAFAPKPND